MKKNIFIVITICIMLLFQIKVEAACTTQDKNALREEAKLMKIIPVLDEEDLMEEYSYGVSFTNWNKDFYLIDNQGTSYYYPDDYAPENVYGFYQPGSVQTFKVYARYGTKCAFEHLTTIRVTFQNYNKYYSSPLCKGIEDFKLCQRTYSGKIESYEWFEQEVKKYKQSLEEKPNEEKDETIIDQVINYIKENPIVLITSVVIIISIIIITIKKVKDNKKRIKINLDLK